MKAFFASLILATIVFAETGRSPVISSERTRNLRGLDYAPMLFEYHRQTVDDGRHFFIYPRRDTTFQKDFYKNHGNAMGQSQPDRVALFMNEDGYFVFDVNTVYKHRHILANNTFVYDTDKVYCVWQNSLKENNIVNIDLDLFEREGETYRRYSEHFKERAYEIDELTEMLSQSGFEVKAVYRDMSTDSLQADSDRAVFVARIREAINRE